MLLSSGGRAEAPVTLTSAELRAKADYYDVFSLLFRDGFFKPQGVWCAAHGVEYQVHLNAKRWKCRLVRSEGSFMRDMKYVQVPAASTPSGTRSGPTQSPTTHASPPAPRTSTGIPGPSPKASALIVRRRTSPWPAMS